MKLFKVDYTITNHVWPCRCATIVAEDEEQISRLLTEWWKPFECKLEGYLITSTKDISGGCIVDGCIVENRK